MLANVIIGIAILGLYVVLGIVIRKVRDIEEDFTYRMDNIEIKNGENALYKIELDFIKGDIIDLQNHEYDLALKKYKIVDKKFIEWGKE